jgi:hypothetical protein
MIESILSSPLFWIIWVSVTALSLFVGVVTTPGRMGRVACHWGLHDTHEVPGYPGRIRVVCVRCTKRWETTT